MRLRFAVLASVLAAVAIVPVAGVNAAPTHHRGLTINATPNPATAGNGVLIYGQLNGANSGGKTIRLFQRINPNGIFTPAGRTTSTPQGFYSFQKVVDSNREWYVRGPSGARSRVYRERVAALISLTASSLNTDTKHPVVFSGHVTPNHTGDRVYLQEQKSTTTNPDQWHTLRKATAVIGAGSNYSISYRFVIPGDRDVRVVLRDDARNIRSASDPVTVSVQQAQVKGFTINTSAPIIPEGSGATISGVLARTNTSQPTTSVTLWARTADQHQFTPVGTTNTGTDGSYSFGVHPTVNTVYQVRTTFAPRRSTAVLFEGVRDVVSLYASSSTAPVGGKVTFIGAVSPDKAGRLIYLQLQGTDGDWHNIQFTHVNQASTFSFVYRVGQAGPEHFRARITSDEHNVGGASAPVTVTGTGIAPITTLPPAS